MPNFTLFLTVRRNNRGSRNGIEEAAATATSKGIDVVAIGIGDNVSKKELEILAGDAARVFTVEEMDNLTTLVSSICETFQGEVRNSTISRVPSTVY